MVFFILLGLASCGNIVEEINLEKDGSGSYEVKTDIIPATVNMTVTFTKMFAAMDTTNVIDVDSLTAAVQEKVWEDFGDGEVDSIIDMANEIPDSLKDDPEYLAFVERVNVFMRGSKEKGYMNMGMEFNFTDGDDYQFMLNKFEEIQSSQGDQKTGSPLDDLSSVRSRVTIESDKKHFVRKTEYLNPIESEEEVEGLQEMLGDGKFITVVNTKRKIKKVNAKHIKRVEDYSVTFEYDFIEAFMGRLNTDFEIIFE